MLELSLIRIFLILFATTRITNIIQQEDSPFNLIERFRNWVLEKPSNEGSFLFTLQKWFECVYCGSVVVGIFLIPLLYALSFHFNFENLVDYVLMGFVASQFMLFIQISVPKYANQYFIAIKASRPTTMIQKEPKG